MCCLAGAQDYTERMGDVAALAAFLLARRLRLVDAYVSAVTEHDLSHADVFWAVLPPEVQRYALHTLQMLRVMLTRQDKSNTMMSAGVAELILTYLAAPHVSVNPYVPQRVVDTLFSPRPEMGCGVSSAAASTPRRSTPPPMKRLRSDMDEDSMPALQLQPSQGQTPVRRSGTMDGTAAIDSAGPSLDFFVRPPFLGITKLFVRMVTTAHQQLNEEEMNRYFGRYGQVSATRLRTVRGAAHDSQDFIVEVDSTQNALQAVRELHHPEIGVIAPFDSARNEYTAADLDTATCTLTVVHDDPADRVEGGSAAGVSSSTFVPELILENVPYWYTAEQIAAHCSVYGNVTSVRQSIDDRSGAFTGAALVMMSTLQETKKAAQGLHGREMDERSIVCGVLDERLNIVSLLDETVVLKPFDKLAPSGALEREFLLTNRRLWL